MAKSEAYQELVKTCLSSLHETFANAAIGVFSNPVDIPENAPEEVVTLYTGINIMLDVINRQLADLRKHAKEEETLNQLKTEFISMISHQLRTPLALMRWSLERLEPEEVAQLSARAQEDIGTIRTEVGKMTVLVSDILDVSRLEAGTLVVRPRPTDLVAAAHAAVVEHTGSAIEKKITITEEYKEKEIIVPADPTLLHVIYSNLLSNAVKYTPIGGTVHISVVRNENHIQISVIDNGFGIPADEQTKVFDKLFRGIRAQSADSTGTGLGLYIVHAVVEAAGGTIRFESAEGKGTTFFVEFPEGGMQAKGGNIHLHAPRALDVPHKPLQ